MKVAERFMLNLIQYIQEDHDSFDDLLFIKAIVNSIITLNEDDISELCNVDSKSISRYYAKTYWILLSNTSIFNGILDPQLADLTLEINDYYTKNYQITHNFDEFIQNLQNDNEIFEVFIKRFTTLIELNTIKRHQYLTVNDIPLLRIDESFKYIIVSDVEIALIRLNIHSLNAEIKKSMSKYFMKQHIPENKLINVDLDIDENDVQLLDTTSTESSFDMIEEKFNELFAGLGIKVENNISDEDDEFKN